MRLRPTSWGLIVAVCILPGLPAAFAQQPGQPATSSPGAAGAAPAPSGEAPTPTAGPPGATPAEGGYTVRLRPESEPDRIRAWMGVQVEGNTTRQVIASLLGEPGVVALHDTNGRWDLLAEIEASSMRQLSDGLERVRLIGGIRGTETNIHLTTYR